MKGILRTAAGYSSLQNLLGSSRSCAVLVKDYIQARPGDRVLDLGCGTSEILRWLPSVDYTGLDLPGPLFEAARKRFAAKAKYKSVDFREPFMVEPGVYDRVLALGLLHHLDDEAGSRVLFAAHQALKPGGILVTMDGCFMKGQNWIARKLLEMDRGRYIRTPDKYLALTMPYFSKVRSEIRKDILRVPYTHWVMRLEK